MARLRPSEWVVAGFVAYCAVRVALAPWSPVDLRGWVNFPSLDMLALTVAVCFIRSLRPWLPRIPSPKLVAVGAALLGALTLFSLQANSRDVNIESLHAIQGLLLALDVAGLAALAWHLKSHDPAFTGWPAFARRGAGELAAHAREWFPPLAMIALYAMIPNVISRGQVPDRDSVLMAIDRALFLGHDPLDLCARLITPWLSEWMAFCYSAYLFLVAVTLGALYLDRDPLAFRRWAFLLTLTLALGYVGYTLVPAVGPVFARGFDTDIPLRYMGAIKEILIDRTRIQRDCFPSLHTAVTVALSWALYRQARPLFRILSPVIVTIPAACIYLRYHYAIDVLAGIALAVLTTWIAWRVYPAGPLQAGSGMAAARDGA